MKPVSVHKTLDETYKFLKNKYPQNLIIPTVSKNPKFPHKNGQWDWNLVKKHERHFGEGKNCAILLKTFIVIDFDDINIMEKYLEKFPILETCPRVNTKKGAHFYPNNIRM